MELKRKLAAIIVADVVGYSRLISEDEEATLRLLETCREIWETCAVRYNGRIFNTAGDAVLLEFRSAVDAARCAIDVQERARVASTSLPKDRQMLFRIGITIGDVVERGADLLGDGVNIAARLQALAKPGGICVSSWVQEQVANRLSVDFIDLGEQTVKNIPKPIRAYYIVPAGQVKRDSAAAVAAAPVLNVLTPSIAWVRTPGNGLIALAAVAVVGVLAGLVWAGWPGAKPDAVATPKATLPALPAVVTQKAPGPGDVFRDCPTCPEVVVVPAGEFTMGSPAQELGHRADETPQRIVTISRSFAVSRASITRDEFIAFVEANGDYRPAEVCRVVENGRWTDRRDLSFRVPGFAQAGDHPVVCVNWHDAKAYADWLSRTTGKRYRLPTEAEREYFTRAGTKTPFWWGSDIQPSQANYDASNLYGSGGVRGESRRGTIPATAGRPNPWGLFNVHGNVSEWVEDCDHDSYKGAPYDGSAWIKADCTLRVLRGGSWGYDPKDIRSAYRDTADATRRNFNFGFRLVRELDDTRAGSAIGRVNSAECGQRSSCK